jgi:ATP-binding cassette subfamily B protein/ATP-binding cassette subfamily C protein
VKELEFLVKDFERVRSKRIEVEYQRNSTMNLPVRQYWNLLVNYLKPQWARAGALALLLLANIGLRLVNPQIMRFFIDSAVSGGAQETLLRAALLFFGLALVSQALAVGATYVSEVVAWTATNALRLDLLKHCLELDQSFHKAHTPGELIERIDGDVNTLANFFSRFVMHIAGNFVLLLGVLVLLFREDWRAGLALTVFALLGLLTLVRIRAVAVPYWARVRQESATFFGFLGEQLAGTEDIRANGAQGYVMRRFYEIMRRWLPVQVKAGMAGYAMWTASTGVFAVGNAIAFGVSAYLWRNDVITIGAVYLIFHYTELLRGPIAEIRTQLTDLQQAEASIGRIETLQGIQPGLADGSASLPGVALSVAFQGVSFAYQDSSGPQNGSDNGAVLHDLTFQLPAGRVLGLLGRTGSGKTTLARLLLRLYDPSEGEILLGGAATSAARLRGLRQRVGLVTQEVQLFQASVRDNLSFFNPAIPDEQIRGVLEDLGLCGWLAALPDGLDTELEAGGGQLSAGQAQLLALARVFLADPGLVILDEASSRLDPATEQLIERAVDRLLQGRTGVVIAHRLDTVQRADEILILEGGRILEHGERLQLAADGASHFSRLLQTGLEEVLA